MAAGERAAQAALRERLALAQLERLGLNYRAGMEARYSVEAAGAAIGAAEAEASNRLMLARAEAGRDMSTRPTWSTDQRPQGQGKRRETLPVRTEARLETEALRLWRDLLDWLLSVSDEGING